MIAGALKPRVVEKSFEPDLDIGSCGGMVFGRPKI
jgi:hypothetical protein